MKTFTVSPHSCPFVVQEKGRTGGSNREIWSKTLGVPVYGHGEALHRRSEPISSNLPFSPFLCKADMDSPSYIRRALL